MKHRRTVLCLAILVLGMIFGFLFIFPFLATNLGLFPSLETNEPMELSWSVGPPQGDIFSGVWYNDSLVLEVRNNDSENDYRIFCYILINHETEILENTSITIAVSTLLEESGTWADAQLVVMNETENFAGDPFLLGQFTIEDDILPAKHSSPNWQRHVRIHFKVSENAPAGVWRMTIRILAHRLD